MPDFQNINKIVFVTYDNPDTGESCLDGLTEEEYRSFKEIVFKQLKKGVKITVNYREEDMSSFAPK